MNLNHNTIKLIIALISILALFASFVGGMSIKSYQIEESRANIQKLELSYIEQEKIISELNKRISVIETHYSHIISKLDKIEAFIARIER